MVDGSEVGKDLEAQKAKEDEVSQKGLRFTVLVVILLILLGGSLMLVWHQYYNRKVAQQDSGTTRRPAEIEYKTKLTPESKDEDSFGDSTIVPGPMIPEPSPFSWGRLCCCSGCFSFSMFFKLACAAAVGFGTHLLSGKFTSNPWIRGTSTFLGVAVGFLGAMAGSARVYAYRTEGLNPLANPHKVIHELAQVHKNAFLRKEGVLSGFNLTALGVRDQPSAIRAATAAINKAYPESGECPEGIPKIVRETFQHLTIHDITAKDSPLRVRNGDVLLWYVTKRQINSYYAPTGWRGFKRYIARFFNATAWPWLAMGALNMVTDKPEHVDVVVEHPDEGLIACWTSVGPNNGFNFKNIAKKCGNRLQLGYVLKIRRFNWKGSRKDLAKKTLAFYDAHKGFKYFMAKIYVPQGVYKKASTGKLLKILHPLVKGYLTEDETNAVSMFGGIKHGMTYQDYKDTDADRNDAFCGEYVARYYDYIGVLPHDTAPRTYLPAHFDGVEAVPGAVHAVPGAEWDPPLKLTGNGSLEPLKQVVNPSRPDLEEPQTEVYKELFEAIDEQMAWSARQAQDAKVTALGPERVIPLGPVSKSKRNEA